MALKLAEINMNQIIKLILRIKYYIKIQVVFSNHQIAYKQKLGQDVFMNAFFTSCKLTFWGFFISLLFYVLKKNRRTKGSNKLLLC